MSEQQKEKGKAPDFKGYFYTGEGDNRTRHVVALWAREGKKGLTGMFGDERVIAFPAGETKADGSPVAAGAPMQVKAFREDNGETRTEDLVTLFPRTAKKDGTPIAKPFLSGQYQGNDVVVNVLQGHALAKLPVPTVDEAEQAEESAPAAAAGGAPKLG